ncbi:MAG: alpha/beta fold hydrolase [Herbiconiux sp.]|nr:MAG: alpha/beta fold hydrolase [Herbiconiux sp.]
MLWAGPSGAPVLVLVHGAGAAMDSVWMNRMCELLGERGIRTARFEFAYMAARRSGARKPPPRAETLLGEYRTAVAAVRAALAAEGEVAPTSPVAALDTGASRQVTGADAPPVAIGGKSMGGRVASMVTDELFDAGAVSALVCFGYPFHPPGAPEKLRTAHLESLRTPALILQGTRDPFGTREQVPGYPLATGIRVSWLEDGEHEFKPRVKLSGFTHDEHLSTAAAEAAAFVSKTAAPRL